jgi:hypothetical protein
MQKETKKHTWARDVSCLEPRRPTQLQLPTLGFVGLRWWWVYVGQHGLLWAYVGLRWLLWAYVGRRWLSWAHAGCRGLPWPVGLRLVGAGGSKRGVDGCWRLEKRCWWVPVGPGCSKRGPGCSKRGPGCSKRGPGCSKRGAVHQNVRLVVRKGVLVA